MKKLIIIICLICSIAQGADNVLGEWGVGTWSAVVDGNRTFTFGGAAADPDFKMTWAIPDTNTVTIPTVNGATYSGTINWGDGSGDLAVTAWNDADFAHSYASADDYQITISGTNGRIYFNNTGHKLLLTSIDNFGDVGWESFANAFYGCANLVSISGSGIFTGVSSCSAMFRNCTSLLAIDFSGYDISSCTTFFRFALACSDIVSINLSNADLSSVENFNSVASTDPLLEVFNITDTTFGSLTTVSSAWNNNPKLLTVDIACCGNVSLFLDTFKGDSTIQMELFDFSASATDARNLYQDCIALTGDVSKVENASTSLTRFGMDGTALTYESTGGFLASNVKDGFALAAEDCNMNSNYVSNILIDLVTSGASNLVVNVAGNNDGLTVAGEAAETTIVARNGTVTAN